MSAWGRYDTSDAVSDLPAPAVLLEEVCAIARDAGAAILEVYGTRFLGAAQGGSLARNPRRSTGRSDHSAIGLTVFAPRLPVLSEESSPQTRSGSHWRRYWLVDPLDGTKEFLKRNGEFTVNIALVSEHRAVLGVVYAPAIGELYWGAIDAGAWAQRAADPPRAIRVRRAATVAACRRQPQPPGVASSQRTSRRSARTNGE